MPEFLTQEEIDSLLQAAQQEALGVDQRMRQDVVSYDFRRPNRISKNQLRSIQNLHETFAETLSYYFVSKLQTVATVNVTSVDQLFYSEYILSVTNQTASTCSTSRVPTAQGSWKSARHWR